jgi:hypothetical protein
MSDLYFSDQNELKSLTYGYIGIVYADDESDESLDKQFNIEYSYEYGERYDVYNGTLSDVKQMIIDDFKMFLKFKIDEYTEMLKVFG